MISPLRHEVTKKGKTMHHLPLSEKEELIAKHIVDAAFKVHKNLGPGLIEKVYEACFCHELSKQGIPYRRQAMVPIVYDGTILEEDLRLDVLVDDLIICEFKAVEVLNPIWEAQLITYLKLTRKRLGFLINFNVVLIKKGIKRIIL